MIRWHRRQRSCRAKAEGAVFQAVFRFASTSLELRRPLSPSCRHEFFRPLVDPRLMFAGHDLGMGNRARTGQSNIRIPINIVDSNLEARGSDDEPKSTPD